MLNQYAVYTKILSSTEQADTGWCMHLFRIWRNCGFWRISEFDCQDHVVIGSWNYRLRQRARSLLYIWFDTCAHRRVDVYWILVKAEWRHGITHLILLWKFPLLWKLRRHLDYDLAKFEKNKTEKIALYCEAISNLFILVITCQSVPIVHFSSFQNISQVFLGPRSYPRGKVWFFPSSPSPLL